MNSSAKAGELFKWVWSHKASEDARPKLNVGVLTNLSWTSDPFDDAMLDGMKALLLDPDSRSTKS